MTDKFRFDNRSKAQFSKDIKECTSIERGLMQDYIKYLNNRPNAKHEYTFIDYGVDNSGNFLESSKVNTKADFLLKHPNQKDRHIEIKFCRKDNSAFHLKIHQIQQYIKKDVAIVNWMGIDTPNKRFCILTPVIMQELLKSGKRVFFKPWMKECIKIENKDMVWIKP